METFPPWQGPRYLRASKRTSDLIFLLRHISLILKTNASLTSGLAVGIDECRVTSSALAVVGKRMGAYVLLAVALLAWNAFPAWHLIEPRPDVLMTDIALGMLAVEVVVLAILGRMFWSNSSAPPDPAARARHMQLQLLFAKSVDRILGGVLIFLLVGIAFVLIVSGEIYFGVLWGLLVMLLTAVYVLRARKMGRARGPFTRLTSAQTRFGVKRIAVMIGLRETLEQGATLGEAATRLSNFFPPHVAGRIRAAEQTGNLADTMSEITRELECEATNRGKRSGSHVYLFLMMTLQVFIVSFLLIKVVPVFAEIYEEFGANLPESTRQLIGAGDFFLYKWPHMVVLSCAIVVFITAAYRYAPGAKWLWARLLLSLPAVGAAQRYRNAARIARMLGDLLHAGVSLHEALKICATAGIGPVYARILRQWMPLAAQGHSLSECANAAARPYAIPPGLAAAAQLGESSGAIRDSLHHAADHYEDCAHRAAAVADTFTYPFLLAPMALITYFVSNAVYSTLAGMSDALFYSL